MRQRVRRTAPVLVDAAWLGGSPALVAARLHGHQQSWLFAASYLLPPLAELTSVTGREMAERDASTRAAVRLLPGEFAVKRRDGNGAWFFFDFAQDEELPRRVMAEIRQII